MHFVIICAARTGSSHFVNVLSGHPELLVHGNIFYSPRRRRRLYVFWPEEDLTRAVKQELMALREQDPQAFLDRILEAAYGRSHVGFKIFDRENNNILDRLIEAPQIGKIILYRRNILANFSSRLVAASTGKYEAKEGQAPVAPPKIRFNGEKFVRFCDQYNGFYRRVLDHLNAVGQPFCFVNYEDINEVHVLKNIVQFIGADVSKVISKEKQYRHQIKQNSSEIISRFSNKAEVKAFLREHGLMHWAQEGELSFDALSADATEAAGTDDPAAAHEAEESDLLPAQMT